MNLLNLHGDWHNFFNDLYSFGEDGFFDDFFDFSDDLDSLGDDFFNLLDDFFGGGVGLLPEVGRVGDDLGALGSCGYFLHLGLAIFRVNCCLGEELGDQRS